MFTRRLVYFAALCWLAPAAAFAQSGETEVGEVSALGGGMFGAGSHPAVTGSAGTAISRYGMILLNVSFMPLGQHTIQNWPEPSTVNRSFLYDFGLDVHIRIPVKERWAPYGIAGAGLLWNTVRQNSVDSQGMAVMHHYSQVNGALHTGAGLRYYIGNNWGIRPEVKVIVSKQTYTQLLLGIFYVTPPNWP